MSQRSRAYNKGKHCRTRGGVHKEEHSQRVGQGSFVSVLYRGAAGEEQGAH